MADLDLAGRVALVTGSTRGRVAVMYDGRLVAQMPAEGVDRGDIGRLMAGGDPAQVAPYDEGKSGGPEGSGSEGAS